MKTMIIVMSFLFALNTQAKSASYQMEFKTTKDVEQVLFAITDYANSCQSGCVNYLPSVDKIQRLDDIDYTEDQYYTWTFVNDFLDSKFFSKVTITKSDNEILIETQQVNGTKANQLARKSGLSNDSLLDSSKASYRLQNINGETLVSYNINVSFSGFILNRAKKKIQKGLSKTANAIKKNLLK